MAGEAIRIHEHVLIARGPRCSGTPITGTAVGRRVAPTGEVVYTVVLDAPTESGGCVVECYESQLLALAEPQIDR